METKERKKAPWPYDGSIGREHPHDVRSKALAAQKLDPRYGRTEWPVAGETIEDPFADDAPVIERHTVTMVFPSEKGEDYTMHAVWLVTAIDREGDAYGYAINVYDPHLSEHGTIRLSELSDYGGGVVFKQIGGGPALGEAIADEELRAEAARVARQMNEENPNPPKGTRGRKVNDGYRVKFDRDYFRRWVVESV